MPFTTEERSLTSVRAHVPVFTVVISLLVVSQYKAVESATFTKLALQGKNTSIPLPIFAIGTTPDGKYKAFRPDMFNAVTSGMTVVASSFKVAEDKEVDPIYQIANLEDLWTENEIYLFTTSSNIMDMSSVKEVVYLSSDIKEMDILGNNLWRTRTKRQTLASNPLAFAKIKLKITA